MTTGDLFDDPPRGSIEYALLVIRRNPSVFRDDFGGWLNESGWSIWKRFEAQALAIGKKRDHWSAYTIIEYLRHETALRDASDAEFKLNQRWTSSVARLFAVLHPELGDLFEFRERMSNGVVALPPRSAA